MQNSYLTNNELILWGFISPFGHKTKSSRNYALSNNTLAMNEMDLINASSTTYSARIAAQRRLIM